VVWVVAIAGDGVVITEGASRKLEPDVDVGSRVRYVVTQ